MSTNNQNGWLHGLGLGGGYQGSQLSVVPEQHPGTSEGQGSGPEFEQLDRAATGSATLKRNPKMELTKSDLLKLVTYFEGEIQARDIVIAALKSEKLKQLVNMGRYRPAVMRDPYAALLRDCLLEGPNAKSAVNERDITQAAEQQLQALEQLALKQRRAHQYMVNILKDAEAKHKKVIQELEEEKCKHEHDTAQGDDITYGLEMERTRLRQELEVERTTRKKLEKEVKRQQELADEERARQKQIVLLLLAERKKIIVKYIEERKRSEDLAQILLEEKARIDNMAEGLEEESKKSLQMEAELEKQLHIFETDKKSLKTSLANKDARCQELQMELDRLKAEYEAIRNRVGSLPGGEGAAATMISSVAKVVQPTATVSSVPVSGPTTGIAQTVSPGQSLRQTAMAPAPGSAKSVASPVPPPNLRPSSSTKPGVFQASSASVGPSTPPPQTPPKKGSVAARGVPPPIPPNKPVIPSKQNVTAIAAAVTAIDGKKRAAAPPAPEKKDAAGGKPTSECATRRKL